MFFRFSFFVFNFFNFFFLILNPSIVYSFCISFIFLFGLFLFFLIISVEGDPALITARGTTGLGKRGMKRRAMMPKLSALIHTYMQPFRRPCKILSASDARIGAQSAGASIPVPGPMPRPTFVYPSANIPVPAPILQCQRQYMCQCPVSASANIPEYCSRDVHFYPSELVPQAATLFCGLADGCGPGNYSKG